MKIIYGITQRITWIATFVCIRTFCKFYIIGRENLENIKTPLLIVSNHRSYWDAMIIGTIFPFFSKKYIPLGFMAKDKLFSNPFSNFFLTVNGVYHANKGKGLDISLKGLRTILSNKGAVSMFPYGKIMPDNNESSMPKRGSAVLVQEYPELTILPILLKTTGNLSIREFLFGKKEMGVVVGKPYKIQDAKNKTIDDISVVLVNSFNNLNGKRS